MTRSTQGRTPTGRHADSKRAEGTVTRLQSKDLFRHAREVEIEHDGRIYTLRLTQLNKLILTA